MRYNIKESEVIVNNTPPDSPECDVVVMLTAFGEIESFSVYGICEGYLVYISKTNQLTMADPKRTVCITKLGNLES